MGAERRDLPPACGRELKDNDLHLNGVVILGRPGSHYAYVIVGPRVGRMRFFHGASTVFSALVRANGSIVDEKRQQLHIYEWDRNSDPALN